SRSAGSSLVCSAPVSPVNPAPTSVSLCASRLSGPAGVSSTVTRTGPAERADMVTPSGWWQGFPGWLLFGGQTTGGGRSGSLRWPAARGRPARGAGPQGDGRVGAPGAPAVRLAGRAAEVLKRPAQPEIGGGERVWVAHRAHQDVGDGPRPDPRQFG